MVWCEGEQGRPRAFLRLNAEQPQRPRPCASCALWQPPRRPNRAPLPPTLSDPQAPAGGGTVRTRGKGTAGVQALVAAEQGGRGRHTNHGHKVRVGMAGGRLVRRSALGGEGSRWALRLVGMGLAAQPSRHSAAACTQHKSALGYRWPRALPPSPPRPPTLAPAAAPKPGRAHCPGQRRRRQRRRRRPPRARHRARRRGGRGGARRAAGAGGGRQPVCGERFA